MNRSRPWTRSRLVLLLVLPAWCFPPNKVVSFQLGIDARKRSHGCRNGIACAHRASMFMANDDQDDNQDQGTKSTANILGRFTSPVIDDPALPLSDALVAQVIGPSVQIAWLSLQHAPQPTWLKPIFDTDLLYTERGSMVAPALIHGAALATCWVVGALAAKAYERRSISPLLRKSRVSNEAGDSSWDYTLVRAAILRGGAFATGLLILATQIDLLFEFGRWVQLGESEDTDFRLLVAIVELVNDVFFEAVTIASWRLYLANQAERSANS
jgi:hypothetical protein